MVFQAKSLYNILNTNNLTIVVFVYVSRFTQLIIREIMSYTFPMFYTINCQGTESNLYKM